jgi:hypothetical protein
LWNVAHRARIVKYQFEHVVPAHLLQAHFGTRPVKGAFYASQIKANGLWRNSAHLANRIIASQPRATDRCDIEGATVPFKRQPDPLQAPISMARWSTWRITSALCAPTSG